MEMDGAQIHRLKSLNREGRIHRLLLHSLGGEDEERKLIGYGEDEEQPTAK
jgi:hypothetical protein